MSNVVLLLLLLVGLVVCLWASGKFQINAGILAFVVAWIVGSWFGGVSLTTLLSYWPTSVMFIAITTALFFGVARENGTLMLFAEKLMYAARNISWFPPVGLYLISFLISCAGAGAMATQIFMSAVGFAVAAQTAMNPLLAILAVFLGGCGGGGVFWAPEGANRIAYYSEVVADDVVSYNVMAHSVYIVIVFTVLFIIGYIVFKGWKNKSHGNLEMKKPEPFNGQQKTTLGIVGVALLLVIGSAILNQFAKTPLTRTLAANFSIQMVALVGFVLCFFLKLADGKAVMKRIPWDLILTVGGMSVMIKLGLSFGVTEMVQTVFESGVPAFVVPAVFILIAGFVSLFSNFTVIYPLLMPLVPVVAAATGANSVTVFALMCFGSMITGMSPFSTGGACCLSGCPDESMRTKLVPRLFIMALVCWVVILLLSFTPLLNIFPDIL